MTFKEYKKALKQAQTVAVYTEINESKMYVEINKKEALKIIDRMEAKNVNYITAYFEPKKKELPSSTSYLWIG